MEGSFKPSANTDKPSPINHPKNQALCDYCAFVMLEAIPLEGSDYLSTLRSMTDTIYDTSIDQKPLASIDRMKHWISKALESDNAEESQRLLAVDRTYLFRGVDEAGPRPPYEGFYSKTGNSAIAAIRDAYKKAGVQPTNNERIDYLGQELAFASILAQKESNAHLSEGEASAERLRAMHEDFEKAHLRPWIDSYCEEALPFAKTEYFKGFLNLLRLSFGNEQSLKG